MEGDRWSQVKNKKDFFNAPLVSLSSYLEQIYVKTKNR